MINLGALNVFLLFILVWFLSGRLVAIFSALIFAIEPTFVISSRLPLAENMITTFMLVSLILVFGYFRWPNRFLLAVLLLVSGGAILLKSTAIFVPVSLIFIFLARKRYREMFYVVGSTLFFVLIWFGYGYYYNWGLFIKLLGLFSGRELWRPDVIASLFDLFRIGEKPMQNDHWILWGWVCAILFGLRKKKDDSWLYFVTTMGGFLIFFSIMSGHYKGWYRFPLYPLLSWAMAEVWVRFFKKPNFFFTFFFTSLPVSYAYIWGRGMVNWSITEIRIYQKIFPILMGIPLLADLTKSRIFLLLTRILLLVLFALMIYWGSITILNHSDSFWYK
jgi:hypothetical protein